MTGNNQGTEGAELKTLFKQESPPLPGHQGDAFRRCYQVAANGGRPIPSEYPFTAREFEAAVKARSQAASEREMIKELGGALVYQQITLAVQYAKQKEQENSLWNCTKRALSNLLPAGMR